MSHIQQVQNKCYDCDVTYTVLLLKITKALSDSIYIVNCSIKAINSYNYSIDLLMMEVEFPCVRMDDLVTDELCT